MPLKSKLIILLVAFTLVPLVLAGAFAFSRARNILETVRIAQLNSIADLKKDKIETFFNERMSGMRSAQHFLNVRKNLPLLSSGTGAAKAAALRELDGQLKSFQTAFGYLNVMLTDRQGRVVYVSNKKHRQEDLSNFFPDRRAFKEGGKGIYFTDVFAGGITDAGFKMFSVAPIQGLTGEFVGEIVFEIDMGPIYQFIRDSTGLGETGEALIVK
ncbi:MAG TPA: cache domain-containing protein, partial [Nitrospirota bacterium]